jgi:hypothetical protein
MDPHNASNLSDDIRKEMNKGKLGNIPEVEEDES